MCTVIRKALKEVLVASEAGTDNAGFNAADTNLARTLVANDTWTREQFKAARSLMYRYRRQMFGRGFMFSKTQRRWVETTRYGQADVTFPVALVETTQKALKVFRLDTRSTHWVSKRFSTFLKERMVRGQSGQEFQAGTLVVPAWAASNLAI